MLWGRRNLLPSGYGARLEGRLVYLRPPARIDYERWRDLRESSRAFLTPWEPTWTADAHSRANYLRRVKFAAEEWRTDQSYNFLIFRQADDALVGGVTLGQVRRGVAQTASLGYWIGEPYARRGYMTEALACLIGYAFGELGLHRIEAACLPHNEASRGLLAKLGFKEEGRAREYLRIDGRWQDHVLFALLASDDWRRRR
ncbi:MAG: GNAT family N-acetyltransferase [Pseudomonadota bacterium]